MKKRNQIYIVFILLLFFGILKLIEYNNAPPVEEEIGVNEIYEKCKISGGIYSEDFFRCYSPLKFSVNLYNLTRAPSIEVSSPEVTDRGEGYLVDNNDNKIAICEFMFPDETNSIFNLINCIGKTGDSK